MFVALVRTMSGAPPPFHSSAPSQLDSYIIERIIRALELVTEMGAKMSVLEQTQSRHARVLDGDGESLPTQVVLLRKEVQGLRELWEEKDDLAQTNAKGRWDAKIALIQAVPALIGGALVVAVTKWLGG